MDFIEHSHTADQIEDSDFQAVVNPGRIVVLPERCDRGGAMQHLSRGIPVNEYGLPLYYIRSDLLDLPLLLHHGVVNQDAVDASSELISYEDGYPTFKNGSPFWTQMVHEPINAYILFQRFIDLAEDEGIRLIDSLAKQENIPLETVRSFYMEFYWSSRCRAYDLFIVAAEAKKREVRTRKSENTHFTAAGGVLDAIMKRIQKEPNMIEEMDAKDFFNLFEQMVKIQRLSLGLVGQNSSSTQKELNNPGQSTEVIFRQLTKNIGLGEQSAEGLTNRLSLLMADQDTAMQIQELIVRATTNN